jgi:DNA invertase Pin-like site-specific DNA recombinase
MSIAPPQIARRAVAYLRLSVDERISGSISFSVQSEHIEATAQRLGTTLVESVQDNAISGACPFKKRPGGKRVLALIQSGAIDAIFALRQERLFRDTREALDYADQWRQAGVAIYFAEDGGIPLDIVSPHGRLVYTVKAAAASYEREQTAMRVRENMASRRLQGKVYSASRYGFDNVDGFEVPNFQEQAVIVRIQALRASGSSLRQVAKLLQTEGIPPKRSARWSPQAINDILNRPPETRRDR